MDYCIRTVNADDAAELSEIYAYYVTDTAVSFEYTPPTVEEFRERIVYAGERYPYLCIENEDGIMGFAFAHAFRERPAYDYAAEVTIYLRRDCRHGGLGRAIYTALEQELGRMGVRGVYACVALPDGDDDPYLSWDSPRFHEAMGYHRCGTFFNCGSKFGRWYTMVWYEKIIGGFEEKPAPLTKYPEVLRLTERAVPRPLSGVDGKYVRIVTAHGDVFFGECGYFHEEYGLHEFGVEEEGLQTANYLHFGSEIRSVEVL